MRFLLDENAEYRLGWFLEGEGHDVTAISRDYPHALSDREVLTLAHREQRILVTNDRDFGELIVREGLPHAGVIYFRIPAGDLESKVLRLGDVLAQHETSLSRFLVVTEADVRVR
jgi:predicted nuclease of predicted toxin-antitoxin system